MNTTPLCLYLEGVEQLHDEWVLHFCQHVALSLDVLHLHHICIAGGSTRQHGYCYACHPQQPGAKVNTVCLACRACRACRLFRITRQTWSHPHMPAHLATLQHLCLLQFLHSHDLAGQLLTHNAHLHAASADKMGLGPPVEMPASAQDAFTLV